MKFRITLVLGAIFMALGFALFMGLSSKFPFKQHTAIQKILMIIVGNFVVISYVVKIFHH
jgi:antibiotic biosynthesis monooxygenase (ABM) superfamily enzyme